MVSHEIDYKIFGDDIQFVEIELDPGGTVIERQLNNETLRIDTGCVVAFETQLRALSPLGSNSRKEGSSILGSLLKT